MTEELRLLKLMCDKEIIIADAANGELIEKLAPKMAGVIDKIFAHMPPPSDDCPSIPISCYFDDDYVEEQCEDDDCCCGA